MKPKIIEGDYDMFKMDVDGITNPCNILGAAGAGLSKIFKMRFPDNHKMYVKACKDGSLVTGKVLLTFNPDRKYHFIFNFPAKPDFRIPSKLSDIRSGMEDFVLKIERAMEMGMTSVAIPALGCGLGGLSYADVKPIIINALEEFDWKSEITIYLIPPK